VPRPRHDQDDRALCSPRGECSQEGRPSLPRGGRGRATPCTFPEVQHRTNPPKFPSTPGQSRTADLRFRSSPASLSVRTDQVVDGTQALGASASGYTLVTSRDFQADELASVGSTLGLSVFLPSTVPDPYWVGDVQMFLTCRDAGVFNAPLGWQGLTGLPLGTFSTLRFTLDDRARAALQAKGAREWDIALNVAPGTSDLVIDALRFL
jgi:hypothetical protein